MRTDIERLSPTPFIYIILRVVTAVVCDKSGAPVHLLKHIPDGDSSAWINGQLVKMFFFPLSSRLIGLGLIW